MCTYKETITGSSMYTVVLGYTMRAHVHQVNSVQ